MFKRMILEKSDMKRVWQLLVCCKVCDISSSLEGSLLSTSRIESSAMRLSSHCLASVLFRDIAACIVSTEDFKLSKKILAVHGYCCRCILHVWHELNSLVHIVSLAFLNRSMANCLAFGNLSKQMDVMDMNTMGWRALETFSLANSKSKTRTVALCSMHTCTNLPMHKVRVRYSKYALPYLAPLDKRPAWKVWKASASHYHLLCLGNLADGWQVSSWGQCFEFVIVEPHLHLRHDWAPQVPGIDLPQMQSKVTSNRGHGRPAGIRSTQKAKQPRAIICRAQGCSSKLQAHVQLYQAIHNCSPQESSLQKISRFGAPFGSGWRVNLNVPAHECLEKGITFVGS